MNSDQLKGTLDQVSGRAKEVAGDLAGSARVQAEGVVDQAVGATQKAYGAAKEGVKAAATQGQDYVDRATDAGLAYYDSGIRAVGQRVEERPLNSIVVAGLLGFAVGWFCRGRN